MSGFTLIEMLVALTIFAFSFAAIESGFRTGAAEETRAVQKQDCLGVAQSLIESASVNLSDRTFNQSGETADGLKWSVSVTPWQSATFQPNAVVGAYMIVVNVILGQSAVTLSTLRAGPDFNAK